MRAEKPVEQEISER